MLILSNGIPKSGSTLFSWFQKDILMHSIPKNGQELFEQSVNEKHIDGIGHFAENIEDKSILEKLISISEENGPFLVKCHTSITDDLKEAVKSGKIIVTLTHRDPRDILLSVIDHGKRDKITNSSKYFAQFQTIEQTIPFVIAQCNIALEWIDSGLVEIFRYQDLISNPHHEILRFCKIINHKPSMNKIDKIVKTYTTSPTIGMRQYNTGKLLRYKEEMTIKEIELCNKALSYFITRLGYQL